MNNFDKVLKEAEKIKKRNKKTSIIQVAKEFEEKSNRIITKKDIYNFFGGKKNETR